MTELKLTTKTAFEQLVERDDVIVKHSMTGPEYITTVYQNGELVGERWLEVSKAEHFIINRTIPTPVVKKSRLP